MTPKEAIEVNFPQFAALSKYSLFLGSFKKSRLHVPALKMALAINVP